MIFQSDTSGLIELQRRVREARNSVPYLLVRATRDSSSTVKSQLAKAAPHGHSGGGPPPQGDARGSLAGSFYTEITGKGIGARATLKTKQPQKLDYVTKGTGVYRGRGRIRPKIKRALYWQGAKHPVKSVRGQKPNNFVKPVIAKAKEVVEPEMDKVISEFADIMGGS